MGHEKPVEPFSDLHFEDGKVHAVLLHDPTVEGLDMAIYMDGSGSMKEEYEYKSKPRNVSGLSRLHETVPRNLSLADNCRSNLFP